MIGDIARSLGISVTILDAEYIFSANGRASRGAARWNYIDQRGEILLAKSANLRTELHEIGHVMNFVIANDKIRSEEMDIPSEDFANLVADILEICYSSNKREDAKQNRQ